MTTAINTSFTSATSGSALHAAPTDRVGYSITGTFVGTWVIERSFNGGQSYEQVLTGTATASGNFDVPPTDSNPWYRVRCSAYTSGTMVTAITTGYKADAATFAQFKSVDVTVTAALLDGAGSAVVLPGLLGGQYKIRNVTLVGGGTSYAAGGDRLISLTDGTTVWTTIANADVESAPAASLPWGNAKVPMLTGTTDTASVAGADIAFKYSGGTTDHSGTGSIKFNVLLEKVA